MGLFSKKVKDLKTLEKILNEIEIKLDSFEYTQEEKYALMLATDELGTNAIEHTTKPESTLINYSIKKTEVKLKVKNKGQPFDWKKYLEQDYLKKIKHKRGGGRGIALTSKFVDELNYQFKRGYVIAYAGYKRRV